MQCFPCFLTSPIFTWLLLLLPSLVHPWSVPLPLRLWRRFQTSPATVAIPHPPLSSSSEDALQKDTALQNGVDSHFMKLALSQAQQAADRGEVPIGALVVRPLPQHHYVNNSNRTQYQILSSASNRVEELRDASAHAEMLALRKAANTMRAWRLLNQTTLYTTVEPCPMCLAAAQGFRVHRIVYGAPDLRVGAIDTYLQLLDIPHPYHTIQHVVRGVHANESAALMRTFFRKRRKEKMDKKEASNKSFQWRHRFKRFFLGRRKET
ncbi:specific adenosine deaminase [Seminavis robusta]|uniref:tRNA(adenine(34)) deaminase n=1 Tax=Seminavis robusta TaxID=568900 RepID=A0A9N8ENG4_9STRA|nr:specific adenosine deaminase [Seminavis robusta]|eukprot:Sro1468_g275250.1 specific adenosine deaminase (265) ;mRNA; f:23484-24278